jgi:hypothetical protein
LIIHKTTPRYKLLGSVGDKAYATKHRIPPAHKSKANGVVSSANNLRGHGVPYFSESLLGPSFNNLFSA